MSTYFSYLRMFVFLGSVLVGIQVPAFVAQYGDALASHLAESQKALGQFQDDADRYFDGNLEKLIAHYKQSPDRVFNAGGDSVQAIYGRYLLLKRSLDAFRGSVWAAYTQALFSPVADVKAEVWKRYSYTVRLQPGAIVFGLVAGLCFTLAVEFLLKLLFRLPARFRRARG